jgi:hypothetical protein
MPLGCSGCARPPKVVRTLLQLRSGEAARQHDRQVGAQAAAVARAGLQVQCSQACGDARARPGNDRMLLRELRLQVANLGLAGLHIGARLVRRGARVPRVKTRQHLTGVHRLMIFDQNLGHIA